MDPMIFKMEEPPELELDPSPNFKIENIDLDLGFEPQIRSRSNTWPLPRPDDYVDDPSPINEKNSDEEYSTISALINDPSRVLNNSLPINGIQQIKKVNTSRRNAWGTSSYADLITQAINSSPEKRLTLSQIYDWMIQNISYFKDKGDSNSSAGWKNSIRHNLSLHSKFIRVQNEGTGKSSWWMLNPDAKSGKASRRRAASMETSKYEKRRGRVKKKVEAMRNGITPSPASSVSESLDLFPGSPNSFNFQLSPDYRQRASSNASSCGRLSPIPQDTPCTPWLPSYTNPYSGVAELAGNLAESMTLGDNSSCNFLQYPSPPPYSSLTSSPNNYAVPPPPYQCSHLGNACNCCNHPSLKQSISPSYKTSPSPSPPTTEMGQIVNNTINPLDDLNLNLESLEGFEYNVDEMIQELSMEGLDFNNLSNNASSSAPMVNSSSSTSQPCTTNTEPNNVFASSGQSWVH